MHARGEKIEMPRAKLLRDIGFPKFNARWIQMDNSAVK